MGHLGCPEPLEAGARPSLVQSEQHGVCLTAATASCCGVSSSFVSWEGTNGFHLIAFGSITRCRQSQRHTIWAQRSKDGFPAFVLLRTLMRYGTQLSSSVARRGTELEPMCNHGAAETLQSNCTCRRFSAAACRDRHPIKMFQPSNRPIWHAGRGDCAMCDAEPWAPPRLDASHSHYFEWIVPRFLVMFP